MKLKNIVEGMTIYNPIFGEGVVKKKQGFSVDVQLKPKGTLSRQTKRICILDQEPIRIPSSGD